MGILLAAVSILASLTLVLLPVGTNLIFWAFAVSVISLAGAAALRARLGFLSAATLLSWFAYIIVAPFSITTQQFNQLRRTARGEGAEAENAQALITFYQVMEPYALWIGVAVTALIIAIYIFGCRRAQKGPFAFLLDESDSLATLCKRAGIVTAMLYAPMIIIILYDVLQRQALPYFPNWTGTSWYAMFSSTRLQEMQWHLHAVLFLMCFAYAYVRDAHVRIELVRDGLRPRVRVWIELFGCLLFLVPYCFVILEYGTEFALRAFLIGESSSAQTGLEHRFVIKAFLPLGFTILAMAGMSVALKCVVYLFGPDSLRDRSSYYAGTGHSGEPDDAPQPAN